MVIRKNLEDVLGSESCRESGAALWKTQRPAYCSEETQGPSTALAFARFGRDDKWSERISFFRDYILVHNPEPDHRKKEQCLS